MPKNTLDDMVRIKSTRRETASEKNLDAEVDDKFNSYYNNLSRREQRAERGMRTREPGGKSRNSLWFVALVSALFLFFAVSFLFTSATVTIHPKQKDVPLNETVTAIKDSNTDTLPFDLTVISGEETAVLPAGSTTATPISESATGTVVIYNAYSAAAQRLDINTRLEGSNGKLYKTVKQVTVPGMKGSTPGSVTVDIYAAEPGEGYNSGPLDFKIFGFKGSPKYAKFYARSSGDIAGGLVGTQTAVTGDASGGQTLASLKAKLEDELFAKISGQIPAGFVLFKDAVVLTLNDVVTDTTSSNSQASVTIKGTLYGFLFNEAKLTKKVLEGAVPDFDANPVRISNLKDLDFSIPGKDALDFSNVSTIVFNLSGTPHLVWDVDTAKLAADVAGKKKKDFNSVLGQYPNIDTASVVIRPVWKFSFPTDAADIKIVNTAE
ncbi:MAG: hypothetical protein WDN09_03845 [bacterium]